MLHGSHPRGDAPTETNQATTAATHVAMGGGGRVGRKRVQAKHISDFRFVTTIKRMQQEEAARHGEKFRYSQNDYCGSPWIMIWDVEKELSEFPQKVVWAKFSALHRRGIIDGCPCGCRGDLQVIDPNLWPKTDPLVVNLSLPPTSTRSRPNADAGVFHSGHHKGNAP